MRHFARLPALMLAALLAFSSAPARAAVDLSSIPNCTLSSLSFGIGTLAPAFEPGRFDYTVTVDNGVTANTLTLTAADPTTRVTVNRSTLNSDGTYGPFNLAMGSNLIAIKVAKGGWSSTYHINMVRTPSSDATLARITLSAGTLTPALSPNEGNYAVRVENQTASLQLTPVPTDKGATLGISGAGGSVMRNGVVTMPLQMGENLLVVKVLAPDGVTARNYRIAVIRLLSANADLKGLTLSAGGLTPAFSPTVQAYTAAVDAAVDSLTITPTAADGEATIRVEGNPLLFGASASPLPLLFGPNLIRVAVTAPDGSLKTYTVTVTRPFSNALTDLTVSGGRLQPVFDGALLRYALDVPYAVDWIEVSAVPVDAAATVEIAGEPDGQKATLSLRPGANEITIAVTARDGKASRTYSLVVNRAASDDTGLLDLALSAGRMLTGPGAGGTILAVVGNDVASVQVRPVPKEPGATLQVSDMPVISGETPPTVALSVGGNLIPVSVTAPDKQSVTHHKVVIYRSEYVDLNGHWARDDIEALEAFGYLRGLGGGAFTPDEAITRGEVIAVLSRVLRLGGYQGEIFHDVRETHRFYREIESAALAGLAKGDGGLFYPQAPITREALATLLVRAADHAGVTSDSATRPAPIFTDEAAVSGWAREAVARAAALGLMIGMADGSFAPARSVTRAEALVTLNRLLRLLPAQ